MVPTVHYELFAKRAGAPMALELTHAQEAHVLRVAEDMIAGGEFVGVKVVRETLDAATGEYKSAVILKKGEQDGGKTRVPAEEMGPVCREPADFYSPAARTQIARLLEGWLARIKITPFELLHRAELATRLEAASGDLQHAIQKIAVPQSLGRGVGVHQVVRDLQVLCDRAANRLRADRAADIIPAVATDTFAQSCRDLQAEADGGYLLGGGVADFIGAGATWAEKTGLVLDLVDAAPPEGPERAFAFQVLLQPLSEILASKAAMGELLGADLDLGGQIAAMTRLVAGEAAEALTQADCASADLIPPLEAPAQRLAASLDVEELADLKRALAKRLLQDLNSTRRLRPSDPSAELDLTRAIGLALSAAAGKLLPAEDVRAALVERSRVLVGQDFMDAFLRAERPAMQEAFDLARLMDNITGSANRAQAARWIQASLTSQRFDSELSSGAESPAARLAQLARLHRLLARARHDTGGIEPALERISHNADKLEADKGLVRQVSRAPVPLPQKLGALLRMAAGETAPPGPAADRARAEAKRLLAAPDAMTELAKDPQALKPLQRLMKSL